MISAVRLGALLLQLMALGLTMGEGPAAACAGLLLLWCGWQLRHAHRRVDARLCARQLAPLWRPASAYIGLAALLAALSPHGLQPRAIGHVLPMLAVPLCCLTARWCGAAAARRAVVTFVLALLATGVVAAVLAQQGISFAFLHPQALLQGHGQANVPGQAQPVAAGLFAHRLKMAHMSLLALAPVVAALLQPQQNRRARTRLAGVAAMLLALLAATHAHTACAAACLAGIALLLQQLWRAAAPPVRRKLLLAGGGTAVAAAGTFALSGRLQLACASALSVRASLWARAVDLLSDHPLGLGLGNWPEAAGLAFAAAAPLTQSPRTAAHSWLLTAWCETGPIGLYLAVGAWAWLVQQFLAQTSRGAAAQQTLGRAGLFVLLVLGLCGQSHDVLFHNVVAWGYYSAIGLCIAFLPSAGAQRELQCV